MAQTFFPARGFAKRKSLNDTLDHIETLEGDEADQYVFQTVEELEADVEDAALFRWHAPKTQRRQDDHLQKYKRFVYRLFLRDRSIDDEDEDTQMLECFPEDSKLMINRMKMFMAWVQKNTAPRARAANSINMRSLCQYRDSLLYWGSKHYRDREWTFPRAKVFNDLVQVMRYIQKKYGDAYSKQKKTWLGLAELRQLIDQETISNRCIELSEQHQLLWCLGRITALRPGSLCPTPRDRRTDPIQWKNLRFYNGPDGQFRAEMTLDHIDIKRAEDPFEAMETETTNIPVTFNFTAPGRENIMFSPAHRLLTIAVRRGILKNIESLDDLFSTNAAEFIVKDAHLDDPVFYAGAPKGEKLDKTRWMKSVALTEYLRLRGKQLGYTEQITFYSIRRRAATDMVASIGAPTTRLLIGHSPDSTTLERYYLNLSTTVDLMGGLTAAGVSNTPATARPPAIGAPLAMGKLEGQAYQNSRGKALGQMIKRMILADPHAPDCAPNSPEMKNYRRRVKRYAEEVLVAQENEWQRSAMTMKNLEDREKLLKASEFADEVLAKAMLFMNSQDQDGDSSTEASNEDVDALLQEETSPPHEQDFETSVTSNLLTNGRIDMVMDTEADTEAGPELTGVEVNYAALARAAMQLWYENTASTYKTWAERDDKTCPMCQNDDTVPPEDKEKEWAQEWKLDRHMESTFHQSSGKWARIAEQYKRGNKFCCPYCVQAEISDDLVFKTRYLGELTEHVVNSDSADGEAHDRAKTEDGWYDEDWVDPRTVTSESSKKEKAYKGKKVLETAGFDLKSRRVLMDVEPFAGSESIVRGSRIATGLEAPIPPHLEGVLQRGINEELMANPIPPHLEGVLQRGINEELMTNPVPDYCKDELEVTKGPNTAEDMDIDG